MSRGSELQTVMSAEDESEFLTFAEGLVDQIDKGCEFQYFLIKDGFRIQLLRSRVVNGVLLSGRISFASLTSDEAKDTLKVYRKLQRWIKKQYFNKLTVRNINIPDSKRAWNKMWLGPYAKKFAMEGDFVLSQGEQAIVVFEINEKS